MQSLKRVFAIDIEACPKSGGKLRIIACIEDPLLIAQALVAALSGPYYSFGHKLSSLSPRIRKARRQRIS
jgi:hypothetical protein